MNPKALAENIIDQVREAQLKLSYEKETMRLYYQLSSLNHLLGTDITDANEMCRVLQELWNKPDIWKAGDLNLFGLRFEACGAARVLVTVSADLCESIHKHGFENPFLSELIGLFGFRPCCTIEEIRAVFEKYDAGYHCEKMDGEADFDYVLFFEDKSVDPYYYCVKTEQGHSIYHRFIRQDYLDLMKQNSKNTTI